MSKRSGASRRRLWIEREKHEGISHETPRLPQSLHRSRRRFLLVEAQGQLGGTATAALREALATAGAVV
jgi:hypothetical protein